MKPHSFCQAVVVVAVAAGAMTPSAHAAFLGLQVVHHATVDTDDGTRRVFRIYAQFSQGADHVVSWGGTPTNPTVIRSTHCSISTPGSPFFQAPFGGDTAPRQVFIDFDPDIEWDTFATIGVSIAEQGSGSNPPFDQTWLTPGFPTFIAGNQLTLDDDSVWIAHNAAQARADYAGDGDPQLRVLLMQLTVGPEDFVVVDLGRLMWSPSPFFQVVTATNLTTIHPAAYGVCCVPDGTCVVTFHSACAQFLNGKFLGCAACDECPALCPADIAGNDGVVDVNDLLLVVGNWGATGPNVADVNGDEVVDVNDLLAVIGAWGPCG